MGCQLPGTHVRTRVGQQLNRLHWGCIEWMPSIMWITLESTFANVLIQERPSDHRCKRANNNGQRCCVRCVNRVERKKRKMERIEPIRLHLHVSSEQFLVDVLARLATIIINIIITIEWGALNGTWNRRPPGINQLINQSETDQLMPISVYVHLQLPVSFHKQWPCVSSIKWIANSMRWGCVLCSFKTTTTYQQTIWFSSW